MDIDIEQSRAVRAFILANWPGTVMRDDGSDAKSLNLPMPYLVPCVAEAGTLRSLFYWDTYFAMEGAAIDGHAKTVRSCAENFMHVTEQQGFIPNFCKTHCRRSQPPVSTLAYRVAYERCGDPALLRRAIDAAVRERAFWMSQRLAPVGLNHYGHFEQPQQVETFYWQIRDRCPNLPADPADRRTFLSHKLAEAESGWDFTPRFRDRCSEVLPIDLNALLYGLERDIADFLEILDDANAPQWRERAEHRRELIDELLWDEEIGCYHDYDLRERERIPHVTAAAAFALWRGVPDHARAERLAVALRGLETEHGLDSVDPASAERAPGVTYQWDSPNAWPPLQFAAIAGYRRYGLDEDARRLAAKWVTTINRNFQASDTLWEKYNVRSGGIDAANEYEMPPMMGWTAGSYLIALEALGSLEASLPAARGAG